MECATLLRDIRFGMRFFGEKARKFFFYSWLVSFFSFFFSIGKKNIWVIDFIIYERITVSKNCKDTHLLDHLFCQSVLLTFSVKNWVR